MATIDSNLTGWATKQDWIRHEEIIRQLYRKHTLAEVMEIMATQHDFKATTKMYKTRIKQWRLDKKYKENEMRAIVRKNKQLRDQGKIGGFRIRGKLIDYKDVVRYWRRKGMQIEDVIAQRQNSSTPEAVACSISSNSPNRALDPTSVIECILISIRDYIKASFENGTWLVMDPEKMCQTTKVQNNADSSLWALMDQTVIACKLFANSQFQEGGQILISATSEIKRMVLAEHPLTLTGLFSVIAFVMRHRRYEIALAMERQISALAEVLLGKRHPLHLIFRWLSFVTPSPLEDIVCKCSESMSGNFESLLGPMHHSTLYSRLMYIMNDIGMEISHKTSLLQELLHECEVTLGSTDTRLFQVHLRLAEHYLKILDYVKALEMGQKMVLQGQSHGISSAGKLWYTDGLGIVARSQYAMGDMISAERNLREVIEICTSFRGPQDVRARHWLLILENWLVTQGQMSSATQVRARLRKTLPKSADEI